MQPPAVEDQVRLSAIEEVEDRKVAHAGSAKPAETAGGGGQSWRLRLSAPEKGSDAAQDPPVKLFLQEEGALNDILPKGGTCTCWT